MTGKNLETSIHRLEQQLQFIIETDKLKDILRKISPIGSQRKQPKKEELS